MRFARVILAWLIMAALPLQGFAAASMLCNERAAVRAIKAVMAADEHALHDQAHRGHAHHDHAHPQAHDHASHHAAPAADAHDESGSGTGHDHHACALCAASGHLVGILQAPAALPVAAPAASAPGEPVVVIRARSPPQPDKPPRV